MRLLDFTEEVTSWLNSFTPEEAFKGWLLKAPSQVQLGFSGLGGHPGSEEWDKLVQRALSPLLKQGKKLTDLLRQRSWLEPVRWTIGRVEELLEHEVDYVDVAVLVGLGARNASQGYWQGRGMAFLWLEHFLEPGSHSGYLDLGVASIPLWLGHEIAHAVRYSTVGTGSLLPKAFKGCDPWSFWDALDALPLGERLLDEGLATAFARALVPKAGDEQVLGMDKEEIQWLEKNGDKLLRYKLKNWDFACSNPPMAWVLEALYYDPMRKPPWMLENPPSRWGYFIGERFFAQQCSGGWDQRLSQSYKTLLNDLKQDG